jgi:MoaA/NifB/PqqE/SkfB family radical SAM enzyme
MELKNNSNTEHKTQNTVNTVNTQNTNDKLYNPKFKTADIKLGYGCNDKCVHCVVEKLRDIAIKNRHLDLKTDEYLKEINNVISQGVKRIVVTGGEPTIRKDFPTIIDYIHKFGIDIFLQTNGRFLSKPELVDKIKGKIDTYIIALHGPNAPIHDIVTQSQDSFNQTVQGIKNIIATNGNICGKTVISKLNYKTLLQTCKLYTSLGVNEIYIAYPHSSGEIDYITKVAPSYTQIKPYIEECLDWAIENNINLKLESILPCNLDKEYPLKYYYDFTEFMAQKQFKMVDAQYDSWEEFTKRDKKKDLTKCQSCVFNQFCNGVWREYIAVHGFEEIKPVTLIKNKKILSFD